MEMGEPISVPSVPGQSTALTDAAQQATPFCEICEKNAEKSAQPEPASTSPSTDSTTEPDSEKDDAAAGPSPASPSDAKTAPEPTEKAPKKEVHLCPTKVKFKEESVKKTVYGYDNHTNASVPWKSVEKDKSDTIKAVITPAGRFSKVQFSSSDTAKVTITPEGAASDNQVITVKGVANGESEITATCCGSVLGKIKVKTYTKKTKTVAVRLVHEKNYTSTDISDAKIKTFLKKVYKQAVFAFRLTRLPAKTVEFDLNGDGKIDVDSWMSAEMIKIRDECKDDSYDYNIFLVDNPTDGSFGFMSFNQRYGFIHANETSTPTKTFAHELGHGAFGLTHPASDTVNNMSQGEGASKWRLRKNQWDKINP